MRCIAVLPIVAALGRRRFAHMSPPIAGGQANCALHRELSVGAEITDGSSRSWFSGCVMFIGAHVFVTRRAEARRLIARFGEGRYKGLYSLVSIIGVVLIG